MMTKRVIWAISMQHKTYITADVIKWNGLITGKIYIYELEGKPLVTISIVECPHVHVHNHVVQML